MTWEIILGKVLFYALALVAIGSAFVVTFGRNLVRSAFALFFTLMSIAGLFIFLSANFVAVMQIIVYVGGILVLILFGIWLTHRIINLDVQAGRIQILPGVITGVFMLLLIEFVIHRVSWQAFPAVKVSGMAKMIGRLLLSTYLIPFEIATVALLIALIGAVYIGRREVKP